MNLNKLGYGKFWIIMMFKSLGEVNFVIIESAWVTRITNKVKMDEVCERYKWKLTRPLILKLTSSSSCFLQMTRIYSNQFPTSLPFHSDHEQTRTCHMQSS
jgi:hypothetical protein